MISRITKIVHSMTAHLSVLRSSDPRTPDRSGKHSGLSLERASRPGSTHLRRHPGAGPRKDPPLPGFPCARDRPPTLDQRPRAHTIPASSRTGAESPTSRSKGGTHAPSLPPLRMPHGSYRVGPDQPRPSLDLQGDLG